MVKPTLFWRETYCTTTGPGSPVSTTTTTLDGVMRVLATATSDCPLSKTPEPDRSSRASGAIVPARISSLSAIGKLGILGLVIVSYTVAAFSASFSVASGLGTTCRRTFVVRLANRGLLSTGRATSVVERVIAPLEDAV